MKRFYTLLIAITFLVGAMATDHTITISGLNYVPVALTVEIGDNVTINATGSHPVLQVSEDTWNADGSTPLDGGFGPSSSAVTFEITGPESIYYICTSHIQLGMKGLITVSTTGLDELSNEVAVSLSNLPVSNGFLEYNILGAASNVERIEVYNISGSLVSEGLVETDRGRLALDARPGVYIVLMKDRNGEAVYREQFSVR